jgi:hypothetical protein
MRRAAAITLAMAAGTAAQPSQMSSCLLTTGACSAGGGPTRPTPPPHPARLSPASPPPADLGVTYDLSSLQQQPQRISDNRNETVSTWYDYWFGVCGDLGECLLRRAAHAAARAASRSPAAPARRHARHSPSACR